MWLFRSFRGGEDIRGSSKSESESGSSSSYATPQSYSTGAGRSASDLSGVGSDLLKQIKKSSISTLQMEDQSVPAADGRAVAKALGKNKSITAVALEAVRGDGFGVMLNGLASIQTLQHLQLHVVCIDS